MRMPSDSIAGVWRGTLVLGALIASCSPFVANNGGDADSGAAADASATDALGPPDGGASDGAVAVDGPDAREMDAPAPTPDAGFCSGATGIIQCFDFDESDPAAGLTLAQTGGTVTFQTTFPSGSAPQAMVVESKAAGGNAVATAAPIDLGAHKGKIVSVALRFEVTTAPTATEYVARLIGTPLFISVDAGGLHCGSATAAMPAVGIHQLTVKMLVSPTGVVSSASCLIDMGVAETSSFSQTASLSLELGNVNSTSGSFRVAYDNVLVRTQ